MFQKILLVVFVAVSVFGAEEDRCLTDFTIGFFYKELGCKPLHDEASKCPSHFDCSEYSQRKTNVCSYRGKNYEIGRELSDFEENPCVANCRCVEDRSTGQAVFTCANVECFDWHLETENCTRLYSDRSCCSIKTHCKGDAPLPTCLVDGKVFVEGQKFYPKAEPCKECRCKAGFEGKFEEPFCKDVSCDVELHYGSRIRKNCVPVYYGKQGCCPIDWKCPNPDKDEIVPFLGKAAKTTEARCKFGDLEFQQYEELNTNDANVNCKCLTPPYLTCLNLPRV